MQIAPLMKPHEVNRAIQALERLSIDQVLRLIARVDLSAAAPHY